MEQNCAPSKIVARGDKAVEAFVTDALSGWDMQYVQTLQPTTNVEPREVISDMTLATFVPECGEPTMFDAILKCEDYEKGLAEHNLRFCLAITLLMRTSMAQHVKIDVLRLKGAEVPGENLPRETLGWLLCVTPFGKLRNKKLARRAAVDKDQFFDVEDMPTADGAANGDGGGGGDDLPKLPPHRRKITYLTEEFEACCTMLERAFHTRRTLRQSRGGSGASTSAEHVFKVYQGSGSEERIVLEADGGAWKVDITNAVVRSRFYESTGMLRPQMHPLQRSRPDAPPTEWAMHDLFLMSNVMNLAARQVPELQKHILRRVPRAVNHVQGAAHGVVVMETVDWDVHVWCGPETVGHDMRLARICLRQSEVYPTLAQVDLVVSELGTRLPSIVGELVDLAHDTARKRVRAQGGGGDELVVATSETGSGFPVTEPSFMAVACFLTGHNHPRMVSHWTERDHEGFRMSLQRLENSEVPRLATIGFLSMRGWSQKRGTFQKRLTRAMRGMKGVYDLSTHVQNTRRMLQMMRPQQQDVPVRLLATLGLAGGAVEDGFRYAYELLGEHAQTHALPEGATSVVAGGAEAPGADVFASLRAHLAGSNPFTAWNLFVEATMTYVVEGLGMRGPLGDVAMRMLATAHRTTQGDRGPTEVLVGESGAGKSTSLDGIDAVFPGIRDGSRKSLAYMRNMVDSYVLLTINELPSWLTVEKGNAGTGVTTNTNDERTEMLDMIDQRQENHSTMLHATGRENPEQYRSFVITGNSQTIDRAAARRFLVHDAAIVLQRVVHDTSEVNAESGMGVNSEGESARVKYIRLVVTLAALLQLQMDSDGATRPSGLQDTDAAETILQRVVWRFYQRDGKFKIEAITKVKSVARLLAYSRAVATALMRVASDEAVLRSFGGNMDPSELASSAARVDCLADLWVEGAAREGIQKAVLAAAAPLSGVTLSDFANSLVMCEVVLYPKTVVDYIGILRDEVSWTPPACGDDGDGGGAAEADPAGCGKWGEDRELVKPVSPSARVMVMNSRHDRLLQQHMICSKMKHHVRLDYDEYAIISLQQGMKKFARDPGQGIGDSRESAYFTALTEVELRRRIDEGRKAACSGGGVEALGRGRVASDSSGTSGGGAGARAGGGDEDEDAQLFPSAHRARQEGDRGHPIGRPSFVTQRVLAEFAELAGLDGRQLLPTASGGSGLLHEGMGGDVSAGTGVQPYDRLDPSRFVVDDSSGQKWRTLLRMEQPERAETTFGMGAAIPTEQLGHFRACDHTELLASLFMVTRLVPGQDFVDVFRPGQHTHVVCNAFEGSLVVGGFGRDMFDRVSEEVDADAVLYIPNRDLTALCNVLPGIDRQLQPVPAMDTDSQIVVEVEKALRAALEKHGASAEERAHAMDAFGCARYTHRYVQGVVSQRFLRVPMLWMRRVMAMWKAEGVTDGEDAMQCQLLRRSVNACSCVCVVGEASDDGGESPQVDTQRALVTEGVGRPPLGKLRILEGCSVFTNVLALHQTSMAANPGLCDTVAQDFANYSFLLHEIAASLWRYHRRSTSGQHVRRALSQFNLFEARVFAAMSESPAAASMRAPSARKRRFHRSMMGGAEQRPPVGGAPLNTWYSVSPAGASFVMTAVYPMVVRSVLGLRQALARKEPVTLSLMGSDPFNLHACMKVLVPEKPEHNDFVRLWGMVWTCRAMSWIGVRAKDDRQRDVVARREGVHGTAPEVKNQDPWDPAAVEHINEVRFGASGPVGVMSGAEKPVRNLAEGRLLAMFESGEQMTEAVTGTPSEYFEVECESDDILVPPGVRMLEDEELDEEEKEQHEFLANLRKLLGVDGEGEQPQKRAKRADIAEDFMDEAEEGEEEEGREEEEGWEEEEESDRTALMGDKERYRGPPSGSSSEAGDADKRVAAAFEDVSLDDLEALNGPEQV